MTCLGRRLCGIADLGVSAISSLFAPCGKRAGIVFGMFSWFFLSNHTYTAHLLRNPFTYLEIQTNFIVLPLSMSRCTGG